MPWSIEEKMILLSALEEHGVHNIAAIADALDFKSVLDVKTAIAKYERKGREAYARESGDKTDAPLEEWIITLKGLSNVQQNCVSRALKYIALFETHKNKSVNLRYIFNIILVLLNLVWINNINNLCLWYKLKISHCSDCYKVLADLTNGRPVQDLDKKSWNFLNENLKKLAEKISTEDLSKEIQFLANHDCQNSTVKVKTYSRKVNWY